LFSSLFSDKNLWYNMCNFLQMVWRTLYELDLGILYVCPSWKKKRI